jgi:aspartyl-tRNA(Asn)/glutamyl-tRNA(Gln) amidotransferase subunit B
MTYELVCGIESHVQLMTRTKLFCSCEVKFGAPPNSGTCPVCLGHPGTLPVLNLGAFELAMKTALALNCQVAPYTKFDRKHYFYPDLPKNYQISQYDLPFSKEGWVEVGEQKVKIQRVHLEEDAGKMIHATSESRVDLNRAGIPLVEIVTYPVIGSAEEAHQYMTELRMILQYIGASECNMERGEMRCDINLSIRPVGDPKFGTKTEIKNLNSFKNAKDAIDYEYKRQVKALESGEKVIQESRSWDAAKGVTVSMRSKEDAHDYRYFPEPDLPSIHVDEPWIRRVFGQIPELPGAKRKRFQEQYGLSEQDARALTTYEAMADFYEQVAEATQKPKIAANWLVNELNEVLHTNKIGLFEMKLKAEALVELIEMVETGKITRTVAKKVFADIVLTGLMPGEVVAVNGLSKLTDPVAIRIAAKVATQLLPKAVEDYKGGKEAALKSLIGAVMKSTQGRADPKMAEEALRTLLKEV